MQHFRRFRFVFLQYLGAVVRLSCVAGMYRYIYPEEYILYEYIGMAAGLCVVANTAVV